MRKLQSLREYEEDYFRKHPEEVEEYLDILFEEYAGNLNSPALFASLRALARVTGVTKIAEEAGMTRNGVQKALSEDGNPSFETLTVILHAMGYALAPKKLDIRNPKA